MAVNRIIVVFAVCLCVGLANAGEVLEASIEPIVRNGKIIGTTERRVEKVEGGLQIIDRQTTRVATENTRPRSLIEQKTRTVDNDHNTIGIEHLSRIGGYEIRTTADIVGDKAIVRRQTRRDSREATIALPAGIQFDNGAALLANWNPNETPTLEFHTLDVRAPQIERITYSFADNDAANGERTLLRLSYVNGNLRSVARLHLDDRGALKRSEQAMLGSAIETGTAEDAKAVRAANPVRESLIKSPYRISNETKQGHIRYTFSLPPDIEFLPPQTGEQRVTDTPDGFVLDICTTCGTGLDTSVEYLAASQEPTFWMQSDHDRVTAFASEVRESDATDTEKMLRLKRWGQRRMDEVDFAGHYSAADALARRSGDCTEGAVVLAALGRAAGIPTRVASGIVYSRERYHGVSHAFMPHAWTLAYVDGEWKSFDMSLDEFDATHIALTISDGDPGSMQAAHRLAALLQWDAMTEVRERPR